MSTKKHVLVVDEAEFNHILAGLRMWQDLVNTSHRSRLLGVATCEGTTPELSDEQIDALCERLNTKQAELFLGTYEHRHGTDHELYITREDAEAGRDAIARQEWSKEIGDAEPMPEEGVGDAYFHHMGQRDRGEWFHIETLTV